MIKGRSKEKSLIVTKKKYNHYFSDNVLALCWWSVVVHIWLKYQSKASLYETLNINLKHHFMKPGSWEKIFKVYRTSPFHVKILLMCTTYHEDPKWPPVSCRTVALPVDNLWSHVFYGPTEWVCLLLLKNWFFAQTKIGQFNVSFMIQQNAVNINSEHHVLQIKNEWLLCHLC